MNKSKTLLILLVLIAVPLSSAEINFRSDTTIDFYNNINLTGNEIQSFFQNACGQGQAVKDINDDGSLVCTPVSSELSDVLSKNNTANKDIDMNGNLISDLGIPQDSQDAVRQGQLANYVKIDSPQINDDLELSGNSIEDSSGKITLNGSTEILNGNLVLEGNTIDGVGSPQDADDAVPRSYIDNIQNKLSVNSTTSGDYLGTGSQSGILQTNNELSYTVTNGSIILGVQTSELNHNSLNAISYDDHHGVGNGIKWDANNSVAIANNAVEGTELASKFETGLAYDDRFVELDGDTLSGNLSMNSYYLKNLPDPVTAQGAATKSYVDNNDANGTDNQTLSTTADISGTNDEITISNGNTITIDDDYEANTDAATRCNSDQVLEGGDNCVANYEQSDDGDTDSSNEIQNPTVTTSDDQITVGLDNGGGTDSAPIADDNTQLDDQAAQADVNMNGNQLNDAGKIGVNTDSPTQDLDVDGDAKISSSGSSLEMKSNGNVVVTLG